MTITEIKESAELSLSEAPGPYPGARPFARADEAFFFGRDREASQLANMVATSNLTVLYGDSGVGKSSLVNTRLRDALHKVEPDWLIINFRDWPAGCYGRLRTKAEEELKAPINEFAADLYSIARDSDRPILLALDQFEEYFLYHIEGTATSDSVIKEDAALEAELAKLANSRRCLVRVLLSLRSDGLFLLDRLRLRIPAIFANMMLLDPLNARGAQDAIRKPIEVYNERIGKCIKVPACNSELVQALIAGAKEAEIRRRLPSRGRGVVADPTTVGRDRIVAPFLQLALKSLWHEDIVQDRESELRLGSLRRLAEIDETRNARVAVGLLVQRQVNKTLDSYEGDKKAVCADVLERMVLPSGRKVAVRADDFQTLLSENQQSIVEELLTELSVEGEGRLLREFADADNQGKPHFEILHDALAIPILNWISRYREEKRTEQERSKVEKRLAREQRRAKKRLRAQMIFTTVVCIFLLITAITAGHLALQSGIDRLAQFAEVDNQPEFRLRLLASLAALREARRFRPLTRDAGVLKVLQEKLTSSPRDGGSYRAFGVSADGTYIAWVDNNEDHIVVCSLTNTDTCSPPLVENSRTDPSWIPLPPAPFPVSVSDKLRSGFTPSAVGFLGEDHKPVYYKEGILYYYLGKDVQFIDIATLIPEFNGHGLDDLNGIASVDFMNGTMRVSINNWPSNEMFVTFIKLQRNKHPNFTSTEIMRVTWPKSKGPLFNAPPIFSSNSDYAYLERKPAGSSSNDTESSESVDAGSNLVLVLGTRKGEVPVSLDNPHRKSPPVPAVAPARGAMGFSEEGRYVAARHLGSVRVFDVANVGPDSQGIEFSWSDFSGRDRNVTGRSWYSPPIGLLPGDRGSEWLFAWTSGSGLEVLSGLPGGSLSRSQRPNLLLAGMENVYRIDFSRDGRFLFALSYAGFGKVYARVWDLKRNWNTTVANAIANDLSLQKLVCHVAGIEPEGDRFTENEQKTEIGENWAQPCPVSPSDRSHPF